MWINEEKNGRENGSMNMGEGTMDWREDHKFIILVSLCVRQKRKKY